MDILTAATLFGLLVIFPLGATMLPEHCRRVKDRNGCVPILITGLLLAAVSLFVDTSPAAGLLVAPIAVCLVVQAFKTIITAQSARTISAALDAVALCWAAAAVCWLGVERASGSVWFFSPIISRLTPLHFIYAGFGATLIFRELLAAATASAAPYRGVLQSAILGFEAAMPLVALGIAFSRHVEAIAGTALAMFAMVIACCALYAVERRTSAAGILQTLSYLSLLASMVFALLYALGHVFPVANLGITGMLAYHAPLNAFGFVGLGLLAVHLQERSPG